MSESDGDGKQPRSTHVNEVDKNPRSEELLAQIRSQLKELKKTGIFCCGGVLPTSKTAADNEAKPDLPPAKPVTIRWDCKADPNKIRKASLAGSDADSVSLDHLIADSEPAGFGRGGEDVYDETYRKALKLDETAFSTNFTPYEFGIVDEVARLLLPDDNLRVQAQLYKLNVYSGPSGMFKTHVDTPRSASQFGSLVVCLPGKHEGGDLVLDHGGTQETFSWAGLSDTPNIQWAAFYSDVAHSVQPVTSGHRVTITYNLYSVPKPAVPSVVLPSSLPLHRQLRELVDNKEFLPEGGYIGVICAHAYPYASSAASQGKMKCALKGVDHSIFLALSSLGLHVDLRPVVEGIEEYGRDKHDPSDVPPTKGGEYIIDPFLNVLGNPHRLGPPTLLNSYDDNARIKLRRWAQQKPPQNDYGEWFPDEREEPDPSYVDIQDVFWLGSVNDAAHWEKQTVFLLYGNEADMSFAYSCMAIVARIPAWTNGARAVEEWPEEVPEPDSFREGKLAVHEGDIGNWDAYGDYY